MLIVNPTSRTLAPRRLQIRDAGPLACRNVEVLAGTQLGFEVALVAAEGVDALVVVYGGEEVPEGWHLAVRERQFAVLEDSEVLVGGAAQKEVGFVLWDE
jgi:hypothetical protein